MQRWSRTSCEAQTEGFVFGNSNLEHLCWEHVNLHFIPQPEPARAESVGSRAESVSSSATSKRRTGKGEGEDEAARAGVRSGGAGGTPRSMSSGGSGTTSLPHLHDARVEDVLRGFAKDPKALAFTLRDFTVRTLLAMTDPEFQAMFDMFDRHHLSVADFFALKVGVREAKKLLLTIQFD